MRRTRIQYNRPAVERGSSSRKGGSGYVPYSPGCSKDVLDFSDPLRRREDRTSFFCDLCKQQMSSKGAFVTHCNSVFHKEKEVALNKMVNQNEWICHTCEKPFPSKVVLDQHCLLVRHQPMYRIEGMLDLKEAVKNEGLDERKPNQDSIQGKKSLFSFGSLKSPYYCEVCQVDCTSSSNLKSHCENWKHKTACDRQKQDKKEDKGRREEDITAKAERKNVKSHGERSEKELSTEVVKPNDYFCDICDVHISCRDNFLAHLKGKKHGKHISNMKLPYCCLFCDMKYGTAEDFSDHYKSAEHIGKASRLISTDENDVKMDVDATKKGNSKNNEKESSRGREIDRGKRDMTRGTDRSSRRSLDRGRERGRDMTTDRGKEKTDNGDDTQRGRNRSRDERELKSRKQGKELEGSPKGFADKNASKRTHNVGQNEERRSKGQSRSSGLNTRSSTNSSSSNEKKGKLESSKEKKEEYEGKISEKGKRSKEGDDNDDHRHNVEGERKVEIKNVNDTKELGDLREVLNKSINIVITKKVKNDNKEEKKKDSDVEKSFDEEHDLKKDEETILKHHKADLVLREQLLKEHTLEILKYKDAEEEYKRLYLEADYLGKRLNLFKDGDGRKDNDAVDLDRIHKAIRDVREELEIRDVMIQEKERYLIVLKNRIEERTKIISEAEKDSSQKESEPSTTKPFHDADSTLPKVAMKASGNSSVDKTDVHIPNDVEGCDAQSDNEDGDLRDEIERERILKKLAPGMTGLDHSIRKRIVDALLTSDIPRSELLKPATGGEEGEHDANHRGLQSSYGRTEKHERIQTSQNTKGLMYEDSYAKAQTLNKGARFESVTGFTAPGMPVYQKEASSERGDAYLHSRKLGLSVTDRRQQDGNETVDTDDPLEVDDLEREWRMKDAELRRREEELRKRERELLEKQGKYSLEAKVDNENVTSPDVEERSCNISNNPNKSATPRKHGRESLDRSQRKEKEPEQQIRRVDQQSHRVSPLRRGPVPLRRPPREGFSGRKRSRSRSLSPSAVRRKIRGDSQNTQDVERRHLDKNYGSSVVKAEGLDEKWKPVQRVEKKEPSGLLGESSKYQKTDFKTFTNIQGTLPRMNAAKSERTDMRHPGMALKEVKGLPETPKKRSETAGSARREQFALWKSVIPANEVNDEAKDEEGNEKNVKEDIWDTAFGTGKKEPVDKVAMDIFSDLDVDNDYLKGRLHESRSKTLSINRKTPMLRDRKQVVTNIATVDSSQIRRSPSAAANHLIPGKPPGSSSVSEPAAVKTQVLNEIPLLYGAEKTEGLLVQPDDKKVTPQPRGILKRGILKKPTENFDEKPPKRPFKDGSDQSQKQEISNRRETVSQENQQGISERESHKVQMDSKNTTQEESGVLSGDDLQKIQVIIDNFKAQYGPDWDSSAIAEDLKMVLRKQRISETTTVPKGERNPQLVGRSSNAALTEPVRGTNLVPVSGSLADKQEPIQGTLFPIKVPEKATNIHKDKGPSVVAAFGRIKDEENLMRPIIRNPPAVSGRQDFKGIPHTDNPIKRFERQGIMDQYGEMNYQQITQPQPMRSETSPIGMHNERQRMIQQNLQMNRQREMLYNDPKAHHEACYQGGADRSGLNRRCDAFGFHSERRMMLNETGRSIGEHRDVAKVGLQRKNDEQKFPHHDQSVGYIHERPGERLVTGHTNESYRNYLGEARNQRLIDESRKGTISSLADSWGDSVNRKELKLADPPIHDLRAVGNFPQGMKFGEGPRDFNKDNSSEEMFGTRIEERLKNIANIAQAKMQNESFKTDFMPRATPTEFHDRRLGSHGEVIRQREAVSQREAMSHHVDAKGPTRVLTVPQFRQLGQCNVALPSSDELFKYIYKTVANDMPRGMYYCAVCQQFLANERERTFHANSEAHKMAAAVRDSQQSRVQQNMPATATPPHQAAQVKLIIPETGQYQPGTVTGHRGIWPARPRHITPQSNQPRSLGNVWPRYSGSL